MIDLLAVYDCPICGKVLEDDVEHIEHIDCDRDEIIPDMVCVKCGRSVTLRLHEGHPVWEQVEHERWLWATGAYDDIDAPVGYDEDDLW